ncbi:hypothetical protein ASZ90_018431 [hydrocarbon metagenome]|uniref:Na+-translocating membrane potential-generating system MpsC domain-containing protein n=1 Tax=hydrocarbon metagenome TaxID=938273 RepID=A0A0W8E712_9ZZZZ
MSDKRGSKAIPQDNTINGGDPQSKLNDQQRRRIQHLFKIYMEKYFKEKMGKGVDYTKIILWGDMLIIRGEGFLTEPEKYIVATESGKDVVNAARRQVARQHSIDNQAYFEETLNARVIHQMYDIEAENDFWMHVMVFDRVLTEGV